LKGDLFLRSLLAFGTILLVHFSLEDSTMGSWRVRSRRSDFEWQGILVADWEVHYDPISDDYTPDEISAADLLAKWVEKVRADYPTGLIPIYWYVSCPSKGEFERLPFQYDHHPHLGYEKDFLTFFTWPKSVKSGEQLNWNTLPVIDKLWNAKSANKGGFIQQATGWKPSIYQPFVYLPALLKAGGLE
jgi:hypothetical protein